MIDMEKYWYNDLEEDYDDTGEILVNSETSEPISGIVWEDYSNGNRRYEGVYYKGRKHGYEKWWHENGALNISSIYYHNQRIGESILLSKDNLLQTKSMHSYGYHLWTEFYENGVFERKKNMEESDPDKYRRYLEYATQLHYNGEDKLWNAHLKKWLSWK